MKKVTLLILMFGLVLSTHAQVDYYDFTAADTSGSYPQVSSSVTPLYTTGDDDETTGVPIGFDFYYAGHVYNTCTVGINGAISFTEDDIYISNDLASTASGRINMIAPFWDDLRLYASNNGYVKYETTGTAPNRVFTASWYNVSRYGDEPHHMSFLVQLHEHSNQIVFYYGHNTNVSTSTSASIGMNANDGTNTGFMSVTPGATPTTSRSTANNTIATADFPAYDHYTFDFNHARNNYNSTPKLITLADPRAVSHETYGFNNIGATDSGGSYQPTCADFQGGDVWFKFVAPTTGAVNLIRTSAGDIGTLGCAVYHNTFNSAVVSCKSIYTSDTGKRKIVKDLTAGDTYYLRMWDYGNNDFGVTPFYAETIIPNDEAANALDINVQAEGGIYFLTFANNTYALGSEAINGTPTCGGYAGGDLWYKFTATSTGDIKVHHSDTAGDWSSFAFAVYAAPTYNIAVGCNRIYISGVSAPYDTPVITGLTAGHDYWLRVWDWSDDNIGASGGFYLTDNAAGIEDYQNLSFKYYPNPATDVLNVNAKDNIDMITLINLLGQEVKKVKPLSNQTSINIADLKRGIYLMKVQINENISTVKISKK